MNFMMNTLLLFSFLILMIRQEEQIMNFLKKKSNKLRIFLKRGRSVSDDELK